MMNISDYFISSTVQLSPLLPYHSKIIPYVFIHSHLLRFLFGVIEYIKVSSKFTLKEKFLKK